MAIYDYNGTNNLEIGKIYDYNGTASNEIGEVYDYNGTTNSLIYSSEYIFYPNASIGTTNASNWEKASNNYGSSYLDTTTNTIKFQARSGSSNSHFYCNIYIDMTPFKTCYVNISHITNPGQEMVTLMWRDPSSGVNQIGMSPLATGISSYDVTNVNQQVRLDISGDYGNQLHITEIYFEYK